jgi:hypothetical protein
LDVTVSDVFDTSGSTGARILLCLVVESVRSRGVSSDSRAARNERERLRRRYRPTDVRLLFIGEAPPASGRFFYRCDSGLYRAIRDSFQAIVPSIPDADFLSAFRSAGCYLIDMCPSPVDKYDPRDRRAACLASESALSRLIKDLQPQSIATVVRSIRGNVERAAARAGWNGTLLDLPYPGRWSRHRDAFLKKLVPELTARDVEYFSKACASK